MSIHALSKIGKTGIQKQRINRAEIDFLSFSPFSKEPVKQDLSSSDAHVLRICPVEEEYVLLVSRKLALAKTWTRYTLRNCCRCVCMCVYECLSIWHAVAAVCVYDYCILFL